MITDRMTARVLGLVVFVLAILVDTSCFVFARPETRQSPRFALVVVMTSIPMYLAGALFFRKAARMKDSEEEDERG